MIRPVFANTASFTTRTRWVLRGGTGRVTLPVRCGLIEHPKHGPVLIDAGCGPLLVKDRSASIALRLYDRLLAPVVHRPSSPTALLAAHGFDPSDVKRILITHLHADHIGYLSDFPTAQLITDGDVIGGVRHGVFTELLPDDFAVRCVDLRAHPVSDLPFGLGEAFDLFGDGTVLGVPLPGHATGHYGLCFTGTRPLLYAVDTQWMLAGVLEGRVPGFPASLLAADAAALRTSVAFARNFVQAGGELVLCHDPAQTAYDWVPSDV